MPDGTLVLESAIEKTWLARVGGSQTRSAHPGTAVDWGGEVYEVVAVEPLQGAAVRYRLAPWPHGHAIRRIERYDEASERARIEEKKARSTETDKRLLAILFSPILGHLPGSAQKKIERDLGVSAVAMTLVSALPVFALAVAALVLGFASELGGVQDSTFGILGNRILGGYLALESSLRIASAFLYREPMGSALGCLGWAAWRALAGKPVATTPPITTTTAPTTERALHDRFRMLEPLLSFLSAADQAVLEKRFGFERVKWGRRMALLVLLAAGANVGISVLAILSRTAASFDWAMLVVCGYLVVEQIRRLRALGEGQSTESVLGFFFRPLARSLLAASVRPAS